MLTTTHAQHVVVARPCRFSRRAGVRPTMTLSLAKALVDTDVHCEEHDPVRDVEALYTLAVWCLRFSPLVGLDTELHNARLRGEASTISPLYYGVAIDLTGTHKLHKDLSSLTHYIHALFKGNARLGLAPTIAGAWALSRYGGSSPCITASISAMRDLVCDLPVEALRIPDTTIERLHDVGTYTIGQLNTLPRHALADRFGKHLVFRLAQLYGSIEERLVCVSPRARYTQQRIFEPPLTNKRAITHAIEHLFVALIHSLQKSHTTAQLFVLRLHDTSGHTVHKELPLAAATHDLRHLTTIISPIIDSMHFCGELREIFLEAHNTVRTTSSQGTFAPHAHTPLDDVKRSQQELLNAFCVRIGKDRVSYAYLKHSHIPEYAFGYGSAISDNKTSPPTHAVHQPDPLYTPHERPSLLLSPPEPVTTIAMLPDKPPSWIRWRNTQLTIQSGFGPERIAPEWWRGDLQRSVFSERDYFTVQDTSGRWLWVFREHASQGWFMHGIWT